MIKSFFLNLMITVPLATIGFEAQALDKGFIAYMLNDFSTALSEWRKQAELGNATAQTNIGDMYEAGNGVIKNNVLAYLWYSLGSINGSDTAKENKGKLEKKMTPAELTVAAEMAEICIVSKYKKCGF
jgi:TPR repeat protein